MPLLQPDTNRRAARPSLASRIQVDTHSVNKPEPETPCPRKDEDPIPLTPYLVQNVNGTPAEAAQRALESVGLVKPPSQSNIHSALDDVGLTSDYALETLASIAMNSTSDAMKMRAIENVLKMKGMLKPPEESSRPSVNLILYAPQLRVESSYPSVEI